MEEATKRECETLLKRARIALTESLFLDACAQSGDDPEGAKKKIEVHVKSMGSMPGKDQLTPRICIRTFGWLAHPSHQAAL